MPEDRWSGPLRVGIVGAGLQGRRRAEALAGTASAQLTAVASSRVEDARGLTDRYGGRVLADGAELAAAPDVDAVLVCTPPDSHRHLVLAAVAAGKHVLCEKPMARTAEEAAEMADAGERAGVVVSCGFNHRHHPAVARLRGLLDEGVLGRPYFLRCAYGIAGRAGYEREWRCDPAVVSGGHLMEQGIHAVDLAQWLLGDVTAVTAVSSTAHWPIGPLEDNAMVLLRAASGAVAEIHSSLTQWVNLFRLELGGEHAVAVVEGLGGAYSTETLTLWRRTDGPFAAEVLTFRGGDRSWADEFAAFESQVRAGEVVRTPHPGVTSIRVVEAAYRAAREQTWRRL